MHAPNKKKYKKKYKVNNRNDWAPSLEEKIANEATGDQRLVVSDDEGGSGVVRWWKPCGRACRRSLRPTFAAQMLLLHTDDGHEARNRKLGKKGGATRRRRRRRRRGQRGKGEGRAKGKGDKEAGKRAEVSQ